MSPRAFIALLVAAAVALIGAIVLALQPSLSASEGVGGDPMFKALSDRAADVTKLVVQTAAYKATWENQNGIWVATDHGSYPTKATMVTDVVSNLASMTTVEPKTDDPAWYPYIMVGDPGATPPTGGTHITASAANGDVLADAVVGRPSSSIPASHSRGGSYVRRANEARSWLVEGAVAVPGTLTQWFDPIVNIPGTELADVAVLIGGKTVIEAHKTDPKTGTYQLVHLDPTVGASDSVANVDAIRNMAAGIVGVTVDDARTLDGVVPNDSSRIDRFVTAAGVQLDVTLVEIDGGTWAIFMASAPNGGDAAKTADAINALTGKWAFKLDDTRLTKLTPKVSSLVQPPAPPPQPGLAIPPGLQGFPLLAPGGASSAPPVPAAPLAAP